MSYSVSSPVEFVWVRHWLLQRTQPRLNPRFSLTWLVADTEGASPEVGLSPCCLCGHQKEEIATALWKLMTNQLKDPIKLMSGNRHAEYFSDWTALFKFFQARIPVIVGKWLMFLLPFCHFFVKIGHNNRWKMFFFLWGIIVLREKMET